MKERDIAVGPSRRLGRRRYRFESRVNSPLKDFERFEEAISLGQRDIIASFPGGLRRWSVAAVRPCGGIGEHSRGFDIIAGPFRRSPVLSGDVVSSGRSEEHTSELQSRENLVCRLLLEKKKLSIMIGLLI